MPPKIDKIVCKTGSILTIISQAMILAQFFGWVSLEIVLTIKLYS